MDKPDPNSSTTSLGAGPTWSASTTLPPSLPPIFRGCDEDFENEERQRKFLEEVRAIRIARERRERSVQKIYNVLWFFFLALPVVILIVILMAVLSAAMQLILPFVVVLFVLGCLVSLIWKAKK